MSRYTDAEMDAVDVARRQLNPHVDDADSMDLRGHVAHECQPDCDNPTCMFYRGGLFACTRCGSFEGATTTDCPGVQITRQQTDAIYTETLDYRDGAWIAGPSLSTPALWVLACKQAGVQP